MWMWRRLREKWKTRSNNMQNNLENNFNALMQWKVSISFLCSQGAGTINWCTCRWEQPWLREDSSCNRSGLRQKDSLSRCSFCKGLFETLYFWKCRWIVIATFYIIFIIYLHVHAQCFTCILSFKFIKITWGWYYYDFHFAENRKLIQES